MSSGTITILKITLKFGINLQNISRGVVYKVLKSMSPSNIFLKLQLLERYHQNCQAVLAATGLIGLNSRVSKPAKSDLCLTMQDMALLRPIGPWFDSNERLP